MTILLQDLRYGLRTLWRSPGFATVAVVTLALGIGANVAIFSIVNAALLRPLPYAAPDRLVVIGDASPGSSPNNVGFATFQDLRDRARTFASMAAIRSWLPTLSVEGEAERLPAMRVSWNYFAMLGVRPALGRDFAREDDHPQTWQVLMLSDELWRRRFHGDRTVIGRTVRMNDQDYRIVGVLPAGYEPLVSAHFYKPASVWAPLGYDTTLPYACRSCQHLKALGRLRQGVTPGLARSDLDRVRGQLAAQFPTEYPAGSMAVVPLREEIAGPVRPALFVLLGAVGFVLLIACANVANLLLAHSARRGRELALRAALGAGRLRLIRQLLTESLLLGAAGGALGIAVAAATLPGLAGLAPVSLPRAAQAGIDLRVLAFAVVASLMTGVLFGIAPALRASGLDLNRGLASDSRSNVGPSSGRARRLLVIADLALALMLLTGAGLMLKSVGRLLRVDPGFHAHNVLTLQLSLVGTAYAENQPVLRFQERLLERVRSVPGVEGAALAGQVPLGGNGDRFGFHIEGRVPKNPAEAPSAERYSVTPDYFRVMGIPVKRGRLFTDADRSETPPVLVISESAAKALFPAEDPIGKRVRVGDHASGPWRTIVGIAGNVLHANLTDPPTLEMYLPQSQMTDSYLVLAVKTSSPRPDATLGPIREIVRDLDPGVPIYDVTTMRNLVDRASADRRFVMRLLMGFAALAVFLAALGLYGVVAYTVAQRTREIGVRVALGAAPRDILRLVFESGAPTVAAGLLAGVACALATMRLLRTLLFDVSSTDPVTLVAAAGALAAVALFAHWIPARRALRIDPMEALRAE